MISSKAMNVLLVTGVFIQFPLMCKPYRMVSTLLVPGLSESIPAMLGSITVFLMELFIGFLRSV